MSNDYHVEALKGTQETALSAVSKINTALKRYGKSGHKDAQKYQVIYAANILVNVCQICETLKEDAHYDVYIDMFIGVLEPQLNPQASPVHWRRVLVTIEYIFQTLVEYNKNAEAYKLHSYISKIQMKWPDIEDFKYLLNIHGSYLQMLIKRCQKDPNSADTIKEFHETLVALKNLFITMTGQCKENPTDCTELLNLFIKRVITRNQSIQMQLATTLQCEQMENMYNEFFVLISVNSKFVSSGDPSAKFQEQIQALYYFLQMDIQSKLKQQVALQYARILRSLSCFEADGTIKYCSVILYTLLKFAYMRCEDRKFKECYSLLCIKLGKLLAQSGNALIQEHWFQDFIVFICLLFHSTLVVNYSVFESFWKQMDSSLYIAQIKLIDGFSKLTPLITKLNLVRFNCCKDITTCFHIQLICNQIGLDTFTQFVKQCFGDQSEEVITELMSSVKHEIFAFLQRSIDTLISMENECAASAGSVRKLCITFAKLLHESYQCTHAPDLFELITDITRLKSRISSEDWLMLISRFHKNVFKSKDNILGAELLSCYIAELICRPKQTDFMTLHRLILNYHYGKPGTSLFEIYMNLSSPFKPLLQKNEKRHFHWIESQYIVKIYNKESDFMIFTTMAQRAQTKYDFINAVNAGQLINQPSMLLKVQNIFDILMSKKRKNQQIGSCPLSRLEELTLAHTICLILTKHFEEQKSTLNIKEFHEAEISQLLEEKSLLSLSVTKEMERIDLAREAIKAFEMFFNEADIEPISVNDGDFLDWERILEDLKSLASYFQLTGYLDYASEAWLLQYHIANTIDDIQSSLRSLAFFCEYNSVYQKSTLLQLSNEIKCKNEYIKNICDNLSQLPIRQQNFTLICLCQIAYYHASRKQLKTAQDLLNMVKHLHENKLNRKGTYDIVLFTKDIVWFRIMWKLMSPGIFDELLKRNDSLIHNIDIIMDRLRSYVNLSSVDMRLYMILFLNSIDDFAEFAAIRMCDNFLGGYLSSTLKLCLESGLAIRTTQLLCKWALINLQMEFLQKAEIKMQLVECILDLRDFKEVVHSHQILKSCAVTASEEPQNENEKFTHAMKPEAVRKVAVLTTPSLIKNKNNYILTTALDYKLEKCHNPEEKVKEPRRLDPFVLWNRFSLNCLKARSKFLSGEYKDLNVFYENCEKWLEKRWKTSHFQIYHSTVLFCMLHHANFCRANKQYEKAQNYLEKYISHCVTLEGKWGEAYLTNFKLQLEDTKLEQIENKTRNLPIKKDIPALIITNLNEPKSTPVAKSIKYKPLAMTSHKKPSSSSTLKTANFVIFSDRKSPRRVNITNSTSLAAMKNLNFGSNSPSPNSSKNGSISDKENLDECQVIELSDSGSDLDVNGDKPTTVAKCKLPPKEQKLNFHVVDNIDLKEIESFESVTTIKGKSSKGTKIGKSKDEITIFVDEMENLKIDSEPSVSKRDQRSPRTAKKNNKTPKLPMSTIQIDINEESPPMVTNSVTKAGRSTRKRNTKELKTQDTPTDPVTNNITNERRCLPVRQARLRNCLEVPTRTSSTCRRQRN